MMKKDNLRLRAVRVGAIPILNSFIERMGLVEELMAAMKNADYVDALVVLIKNIAVERRALYAVGEWAALYDARLVAQGKLSDDRLGRTLDRLQRVDRATLQTRIVLAVMKGFGLKMDQIHNDTTSVTMSGAYDRQDPKAVQLKHGHSKDHRPDLKQLVYSLCVTSDGAVPVHFKAYDGNQTDDGIHLETWGRIRTLLQRPDFIYVADCKLCNYENLSTIDREHGFFVTLVPKNRTEVETFRASILAGHVRWKQIFRKPVDRDGKVYDVIQSAEGIHLLDDGFRLLWYRSSQKKKRDERDRAEKIERALEELQQFDPKRLRGPKTDVAIRNRVDELLAKHHAKEWITVEIKWTEVPDFKQATRGRPTPETRFLRSSHSVPHLHVSTNAENIARSAALDGIFPLTTNTEKTPLEVYHIYKYQPNLEKRHAMLKSTLDVAPVWLKKNTRVEALMFAEFIAQMIAGLVERELRKAMAENKIPKLLSLPEDRASTTPTIEQVLRLFENQRSSTLYDGDRLVQEFTDSLEPVQSEILKLLGIPAAVYEPGD